MALRSTMADLIAKVRSMVGDTADEPQFTDLDIQRHLDANRDRAVRHNLSYEDSISDAGVVSFLTYTAEYGDWESDASVTDGSYEVLTPSDDTDLLAGRWVFETSTNPPVLLTGWTYDTHAAAADILDEWSIREKGAFDFSADGSSFSLSQKFSNLKAGCDFHRSQQRIQFGSLVRID